MLIDPKLPPLAPAFHATLENPTAPGGKVDMWLIHDDGGDGVITIAVPHGRTEIPGFVTRAVNLLSLGLLLDEKAREEIRKHGQLPPNMRGLTAGELSAAAMVNALIAENGKMEELARATIRDMEDLDEHMPADTGCSICTMGAGPHKRTCAYHLAKAVVARIEGKQP